MMLNRAGRRTRIAITIGSALAAAVGLAPSAMAAPGDWTQLSAFSNAAPGQEMGNTSLPAATRFGDALQVVWSGTGADRKAAMFSAQLNGAGAVTMPTKEILSGWDTLTGNPAVISVGGQRFLGFSGLSPTFPGAQLYATSADGVTWGVGPGSMSSSNSAYAAYGNDVVDNAGNPVWTGNPGSVAGVSWHQGIYPTVPGQPFGSDGYIGGTGCCAYSAAAARDAATGAVYTAWYSNSKYTNEAAYQFGQILPTQGPAAQVPGSMTVNDYGSNSIGPDNRTAMVARPGGGVYIAYATGYPSVTGIRLWQVGAPAPMDVPGTKDAARISLTADPSGRLWIQWTDHNVVKVIHTNPAANAFGSVGVWGAPAGTESIWHTATAATDGVLDVVVSANPSGGAINVWHTQAIRTLTISGSPSPVKSGKKVKFKVTDAGDPVAGVKVKFAGHTGTTNASGKVTLKASGHGSKSAKATKAGFNEGKTSITVK